ncbi:MAG: sugar transferase [Mycobacterium leprae]
MTVFDTMPSRRLVRTTAPDTRRPGRHYPRAAVLTDGILAIAGCSAVAVLAAAGRTWMVAPAVAVGWPVAVAACGGYRRRPLGPAPRELNAIVWAGLWLVALLAVAGEIASHEAVHPYVTGGVPALTLLALAGRVVLRARVRAGWRTGTTTRRVVLVGPRTSVEAFLRRLDGVPTPGVMVAGACLVDGGTSRRAVATRRRLVPVFGGSGDVVAAARRTQAHAVVVLPCEQVDAARLRALAWELRGLGADLVVAPGVADIANSRLSVHSIAGLPLLHVHPPLPDGGPLLFKHLVDRVAAALAVLLLLPFLVAIGLLVRATSRGPALFRQRRVGHGGREFTMLKFRTMYDGAHARRQELDHLNDCADGLLFKLRDDPRVTPVGRWLRRFSLDELPQLLNVVAGHMSLVGPRPPLPSEVAGYDDEIRRRLLVKPGLTGLWQVSGRSDLTWDETVRLDLFYVENRSFGLDLSILCRTATPVLRGIGAY